MFVITQRPSKLIGDASEDSESLWNEIGNPVLYIGQRRDYVGTVEESGVGTGIIHIRFVGVDLTAILVIGTGYYFQGLEFYQGRLIEIVATSFSGGDTIVDLVEVPGGADIAYTSNDTGFINLSARENYRVQYQVFRASDDAELDSVIFESSDSPGVFKEIATATLAQENAGIVYIDVAPIIRPYLLADIEIDINDDQSVIDTNAFKKFYIKYREVWTGSAEALTDDVANKFFAVMGARQIPSVYGGNVGEYVIFVTGVPEGKFLTKLTRPKMWRGLPFLISAVIDADESVYLIVNGNGDESTPTDYDGAVVIFDLNTILVDQSGDSFTIEIKRSSDDTTISEVLTIDLVDSCENPNMLIARNSLGGVLQWVFESNFESTPDYSNNIKAIRKAVFVENITENEWSALQDFIKLGDIYRDNIVELTSEVIKTSTRIGHQVYVVDPSTGDKLGVIVIPTKNKTESRQKKHRFELEFEYPEEFTP